MKNAEKSLRRLREAAELTQEKLGERIGMTQSQISQYEDRPEDIPYGLLNEWLEALGTNIGAFHSEFEENEKSGIDVGDPYSELRQSLKLLKGYLNMPPPKMPLPKMEALALPIW